MRSEFKCLLKKLAIFYALLAFGFVLGYRCQSHHDHMAVPCVEPKR